MKNCDEFRLYLPTYYITEMEEGRRRCARLTKSFFIDHNNNNVVNLQIKSVRCDPLQRKQFKTLRDKRLGYEQKVYQKYKSCPILAITAERDLIFRGGPIL